MTEVDIALTREDNQGGDQNLNVGAGRQSTAVNGVDPYAVPPFVAKSLMLVAEQRNSACFTSDSTVQSVLFRLDAREIDAAIGPPRRYGLNIALVVDRSGSMEGAWLDHVKRACGSLLDLVEPTDFVSVVTFAETADLILPARHISNKAEAKDRISRITAGNTTNLHQGLVMGFHQLSAVKHSGTLNKIILVTDGGPTAGTKDLKSIINQIVDQKARGISVTTVGLGADYDEELLGTIANRAGGNFYHVPEPEKLGDVLRQEVELLSKVVARNLHMRVRLVRGAGVRQVYGHPPIYGNHVVELDMCDVVADSGIRSLWDFEISTRSPGRYRIGQVDVRFDDVNTGRPERVTAELIYEFVSDPAAIAEVTGGANFDVEIEVAEAVRTIDKTLLAVRRQNIDPSIVLTELEKVKAVFQKYGRDSAVATVANAIGDVQAGGAVAKILTNTVFNLDQGKVQ